VTDKDWVRAFGVSLVLLLFLLVFLIWSSPAECAECPDAICSLTTEEICGGCHCEVEEGDYIGRCEL